MACLGRVLFLQRLIILCIRLLWTGKWLCWCSKWARSIFTRVLVEPVYKSTPNFWGQKLDFLNFQVRIFGKLILNSLELSLSYNRLQQVSTQSFNNGLFMSISCKSHEISQHSLEDTTWFLYQVKVAFDHALCILSLETSAGQQNNNFCQRIDKNASFCSIQGIFTLP